MLANKIDNEEFRIVNVDTGDVVGTNVRLVRVKKDEEVFVDLEQISPEDMITHAQKKGLILHANSHLLKRM